VRSSVGEPSRHAGCAPGAVVELVEVLVRPLLSVAFERVEVLSTGQLKVHVEMERETGVGVGVGVDGADGR
jgi:hypothetical protein